MGVEVEHRKLSALTMQRPQQRECQGVVTAQRQQPRPVRSEVRHGTVDRVEGFDDVESVDRDVAGIGNLVHGERRDVHGGVIGPQQL